MALSDEEKLETQRRFAAATASGDPEKAASLCVAGALVWHNYDNTDIPYRNTGKSLLWLFNKVPDITWVTRNITVTATGWIWQAAITGTAPGGPLCAHTCMVVTLNDQGLITQLDEYLDPIQMGPARS